MTSDGEEMIGTGRMNRTGGSATITMPKHVADEWNVEENGLDVAWFQRGSRFFAVPLGDVEAPE